MRARELLERFRPAGTPGAASAAGVPADRRDAVTAELEPVFAALADVERECDVLLDTARANAARRSAEAARRAGAILAAARADAPAERATAATQRRRAQEADLDLIVATGRSAARGEERAAGEHLPDVVAAVVAAVRADLDALSGGDTG